MPKHKASHESISHGRSRNVSGLSATSKMAAPNFEISLYSQENSSTSSEDFVIFFIIPDGLTKGTCSSRLNLTYSLLRDQDINCKWLMEKDCFEKTPNKNNVYVMDPFDTPGYNYLKQYYDRQECYIIGPQILYGIVSDKVETTLKHREEPPFTFGMHGNIVTFSGIRTSERAELKKTVQRMYGIVTPHLGAATTHVVAEFVLTEKVYAAYSLDIAVMTKDWIAATWDNSQNSILSSTDERYVKYACPIFYNLTISVTQVPTHTRTVLEDIIKENGGVLLKSLERNKTNILIVGNCSSEKFKCAKRWSIPCVTPEWLYDCKSKCKLLNVKDYDVIAPNTSTINQNQPKLSGNICHSTPNTTFTESMCFEDSAIENAQASNICRTVNTCPESSSTLNSAMQELDRMINEVATTFLDGCQILLWGSNKELYRQLIDKSGAIRHKQMNDRVTHVVNTDKYPSDTLIKEMKEWDHSLAVVNIDWILQSAKEGKRADEENFKIPISSTFSTGISYSNEGPDTSTTEDQTQETRRSSTSECHTTLKSKRSNEPPSEVEESLPGVMDITASVYTSDKDTTSSINPRNEKPFARFLFNVDDVTSIEEKTLIVQSIKSLGGQIGDHTNSSVYIVNNLVKKDFKFDPRKKYRTAAWVSSCCAENKFLSSHISFHFIPVQEFCGMESILRGLVFAITTYSKEEKTYIINLINSMGGLFQEFFARKDTKKGVKKTSILISPDQDNEKYEAAMTWSTTVVTVSWLLKCHEKRCLVGYDGFHPNKSKSSTLGSIILPSTPTTSLTNKNKNKNQDFKQPKPKAVHNHNSPILKPKDKKDLDDPNCYLNRYKFLTLDISKYDSVEQYIADRDALKSDSFKEWERQHPPPPISPPTPVRVVVSPVPSPNVFYVEECEEMKLYREVYREINERWLSSPGLLNSETPKRRSSDGVPRKESSKRVCKSTSPEGNQSIEEDSKSPMKELQNLSLQQDQERLERERRFFQVNEERNDEYFSNNEVPSENEIDIPHINVWGADDEGQESLSDNLNEPVSHISDQEETFDIPANPCFMLTGVRDSTENNSRELITSTIIKLGGTVSSESHFNPETFATVACVLARSEKVLCSIASGTPLVKTSYIKRCDEAGKFLPISDEDLWKENDVDYNAMSGPIAAASVIWYYRIQKDSGDRPFKNLKFYFHDKQKFGAKFPSWKRLIDCGNGEVVDDLHEANICLVDSKSPKPSDLPIPIYSFVFLQDLIMKPKCS